MYRKYLAVIVVTLGFCLSAVGFSVAQSNTCYLEHSAHYDWSQEWGPNNWYGIRHVHYLRVEAGDAQSLAGFKIYYDGDEISLDPWESDNSTYTKFGIPTRIAAASSAGIGPLWSESDSWVVSYNC